MSQGDEIPQLTIKNEMELPDSLKYTQYNSNTVVVKNEVQLEEMGYRSYAATSADGNIVEWSLTGIPGGSICRKLEHDIVVRAKIAFKGLLPAFSGASNTIIAPDVFFAQIVEGSSATPFHPNISTIDQAPISKIFSNREFTINNAATTITENYPQSHEIDLMVASANLKKMEYDNLMPFATANNCAFRPISYSCAGHVLPLAWADPAQVLNVSLASELSNAFSYTYASSAQNVVWGHRKQFASNIACSWAAKRNLGRNIVAIAVESVVDKDDNPVAVNFDAQGYEKVPVPVTVEGGTAYVNYFLPNDPTAQYTYTLAIRIREQMWSSYWYNDYSHDKLIFNELLPASALGVKYNVNTNYLSNGFLQIGEDINLLTKGLPQVQGSEQYAPTNPVVPVVGKFTVNEVILGNRSEMKLNLYQQKVPVAFQDTKAYKLMYYSKEKTQGAKPLVTSYTGSNNVASFTATTEYSNLSQVPEYLYSVLPICKSQYLKSVYGVGNTGVTTKIPECALPSTFNLPITDIFITINDESDLGLFGQDKYQIDKCTMRNLQEMNEVKCLVVGESKPITRPQSAIGYLIKRPADGPTITQADLTSVINQDPDPSITVVNVAGDLIYRREFNRALATNQIYPLDDELPSTPISNASFVLLKLGRDVRLPTGMTAGMLINFNMTVRVVCDLTKLLGREGCFDTMESIRTLNTTTLPQTSVLANFENYFFNKKLLTLSGRAYSTLYSHNVYVTYDNYVNILTQFKEAFKSMDNKDDIFDSRALIGGSFMGKLRGAVDWLAPKLNKAMELGKAAQSGLDMAKNVTGGMMNEELSHTVTGGSNAHSVRGGSSQHEVSAGARKSASSKIDWASLLKS